MARKLAHTDPRDGSSQSRRRSVAGESTRLRRREVLQVGIVGIGAALGIGTGAASVSANEGGDTFVTDFSEYAP